MGKVTGFLEIKRQDRKYKDKKERIQNFKEFTIPLSKDELQKQSARCMDCGIPFCHDSKGTRGCPVSNQIPDWNDLVYNNRWDKAAQNLHSTNNFPEFTGRICPAPCEESCTLNLTNNPVTIKSIECAIADKAIKEKWIKPEIAKTKTNKKIAIIGAGPAGLACAQQLARVGHSVNVYEKNAKAGGLLRYGIPDFKLEKKLIDNRIKQMEKENVKFIYNANVGGNVNVKELMKEYDAVVLTAGAEQPRDLPIPGRELKGVHYAMEFLPQQNKRVGKEKFDEIPILATNKNVVVIGGGDTGSDCIGTAIRQGAKSVAQLEIMPCPPEQEDKLLNWPNWPMKYRVSSSQAEGATRSFSVMTQKFIGENGKIEKVQCIEVDENFKPIKNTEFILEADLVLLAMGFTGPKINGLIKKLKVKINEKGNVNADEENYQTNNQKIWSAGDMRRGQSLVVWAIREGRNCAHEIDKKLMGKTILPR